MRNEPNLRIERYRAKHPRLGTGPVGKNYGYFELGPMGIISSGSEDGTGWEHVSISCEHRCPTWSEMEKVKQLFWGELETVIQFHPMATEYVNDHNFCLHLWRQDGIDHPLPPFLLV